MTTKSKPIATRIFQIVLFGNLISLVAMLLFAWWSLEQLESTSIEADRRIELDYFENYGAKDKPLRIQTSQLISVFQPKDLHNPEALPVVFQNIPVPFQGEVASIGKEYSVIAHAFPEGNFYLAKDLRLFEQQEEIYVTAVLLLAIVILFATLCLAIFAGRKISGPITGFTKTLADFNPKQSTVYIEKNFPDSELNQIADAVNKLTEQVSENIKRERKFIAMASHELRTPIAVILGAANVMEHRRNLNMDDSKTLKRIIRASKEMSENIQALLTLARATKDRPPCPAFDVNDLLRELCNNYAHENETNSARLKLELHPSPVMLVVDSAMVRILIHNLISNALLHTQGKVMIGLHNDHVDVTDEGAGFDSNAEDEYLTSGLGLYIVSLACEALGWHYQTSKQAAGSCVRLFFIK
jgi:signal transduction histidine kinase